MLHDAKRILIADDEPKIVTVFSRAMQVLGHYTEPATTGREAAQLAQKERFDLILLDEIMPDMTGTEALLKIRKSGASMSTPVLMITAYSDRKTVAAAISTGVDDFLVKPISIDSLIDKVNHLLQRAEPPQWENLTREQEETLNFTLDALDHAFCSATEEGEVHFTKMKQATGKIISAIDDGSVKDILGALRNHDNYTYVHSLRVAVYLNLISSLSFGLNADDLLVVTTGGLMHDVGKVRIPLDVLNKPAALDEQEYSIMKTHVSHSAEILRHSDSVPSPAIEIAYAHHERMDGTGYPRGLKGDEIDIFGRMACIADAYVALTDSRVYKPACSPSEALIAMSSETGHFDPALFTIFREAVLDAKWEEINE